MALTTRALSCCNERHLGQEGAEHSQRRHRDWLALEVQHHRVHALKVVILRAFAVNHFRHQVFSSREVANRLKRLL
jgi:hypothetical protein